MISQPLLKTVETGLFVLFIIERWRMLKVAPLIKTMLKVAKGYTSDWLIAKGC